MIPRASLSLDPLHIRGQYAYSSCETSETRLVLLAGNVRCFRRLVESSSLYVCVLPPLSSLMFSYPIQHGHLREMLLETARDLGTKTRTNTEWRSLKTVAQSVDPITAVMARKSPVPSRQQSRQDGYGTGVASPTQKTAVKVRPYAVTVRRAALVVINSQRVAVELLDRRAAIYSDRPSNVVVCDIMTGGYLMGHAHFGET